MTLKKLQNKLEEKKFTVILREFEGFKWLQCFSQIEDIEDRVVSFGIKFKKGHFIFWDASIQIPDEIQFKSEETILKHIEEYFS